MTNPADYGKILDKLIAPKMDGNLHADGHESLAVKQDDKLRIGIGNQGGFILISFNGPTERIMMSKKAAKELARRLIQECIK